MNVPAHGRNDPRRTPGPKTKVGSLYDTWCNPTGALVLVVSVFGVLALGGCADKSKGARSATSAKSSSGVGRYAGHLPPTKKRSIGDRDADEGRGNYYDDDDKSVVAFGHAVNSVERQQIDSLLARYYAAAASANGAAACSMLYSLFAEAVIEDHGEDATDSQAQGSSCTEILSKIFKKDHRHAAIERAKLRVIGARSDGQRGYAVLDTGRGYPLFMYLHRETSTWKIESLLGAELG